MESWTSVTLSERPLGAQCLAVQWIKANEFEPKLRVWEKHSSAELLIPEQSQLNTSQRISSFEFLPLQVPGKTIREQVWWRQRELLKGWLFLTQPPDTTPLTLGEGASPTLLCSRHPAQAKQPFWPEQLFTWFVSVAEPASKIFLSNTWYWR